MRKALLILFISLSGAAIAQDTTLTKKISHELGVNTVLLVKQIISNNPNQTLNMLPYQVIYTMHFNNKFGVRAGLGLSQSYTETEIDGNPTPRETGTMNIAGRLGGNMNFMSYKKISANAFLDAVASYSSLETHTETEFGFGQIVRDDIMQSTQGFGAQVGFGVKYSFNKRIALYTEVPLQFLSSDFRDEHTQEVINPNGQNSSTTVITSSSNYNTQIFLPTTVFLTIMF